MLCYVIRYVCKEEGNLLNQKGIKMIQMLAYGLAIGHPAAYCIIFLILGIPLLAIVLIGGALIIEKLQEKKVNGRH